MKRHLILFNNSHCKLLLHMLGTVNHLLFWPMNSRYTGFNNDFQQKLFQKVQYSKNKKCGLISFFFGKIRRSRPLHHKKKHMFIKNGSVFVEKSHFFFRLSPNLKCFCLDFPFNHKYYDESQKVMIINELIKWVRVLLCMNHVLDERTI